MITNANENAANLTARELAGQHDPKLQNEKTSFPGQQIGLYNDGETADVKQMVRTLNNPGENSQNNRG